MARATRYRSSSSDREGGRIPISLRIPRTPSIAARRFSISRFFSGVVTFPRSTTSPFSTPDLTSSKIVKRT
jgi:hypothetical protein